MTVIEERFQAETKARLDLTPRFFRALTDPTRLKILHFLLEGEKNVGELVALVGSPQGRVSSHLACLKWCGFVKAQRNGKFVRYRVADGRVRELLSLAQTMIADNEEQIGTCTMIDTRRGRGSVKCPGLTSLNKIERR